MVASFTLTLPQIQTPVYIVALFARVTECLTCHLMGIGAGVICLRHHNM